MAGQTEVGEGLPCADLALLAPLKRSLEYRSIRQRVASPRPVDTWFAQELHFFVFQLHGPHRAGSNGAEPPVAVFTMHPETPEPISAVVITPSPDGAEAEVMDMRQPDRAYTAAFQDGAAAAGPLP
jgi:hypothetical protein